MKHALLASVLALGSLSVYAKDIRVVGTVVDESGEPMIGATILQKGSTIGTSADIDGNFVLNCDEKGTLVVSFVGYVPQEISVKGRTNINVVMKPSTENLDEVVVVGYGTQRKISTVGAQSNVKFTGELKQPTANLSSVLAGRVSGVTGMQRNGEAGRDDNTEIWVRGVATTTVATPLVLVDGVERSWTTISPEDIESFSILKDASATAVYGVKGANGVILIQTKKGSKGKPRIKVETTYGLTNFIQVPDLADGITYMQMANEASMNKNGYPVYTQDYIAKTASGEDPLLYPNVNWMKTLFRKNGHNFRANVNTTGGSDFAQYYFSIGYYNEGGMYKVRKDERYDGSMNYNRVNFVSNLTMQPTKSTQVDFGVKGEISDYHTPYYDSGAIFEAAMKAYPIYYPAKYEDNRIPYRLNGGEVKNPYAMIYMMGSNKRNTAETRADLKITQKFDFWLPGLEARILGAYDTWSRNDTQRTPGTMITYDVTGRDPITNELIYVRTDQNNGSDSWGYGKNSWGHRQYYFEAALQYNQVFDRKHRVSALALFNLTDYSNTTAGSLYAAMPYRSIGTAGRVTYSFDDRYFFEGNFGYNGAENFPKGHRFGFFPSFGLSWVPTHESFFPQTTWLNLLKIRGSWGKAGNSNLGNSDRFIYLSTVGGGGDFKYGADGSNRNWGGVSVGRPGIDLTWEVSTKYNFGIDVTLFNNSLNLAFDIFKEHRDNIFLKRAAVPDFLGITELPYGNLGIIDNKGYEISADYTLNVDKVRLMLRANLSYNHNTIIDDDSAQKPYEWQNSRGHSLYSNYGYTCLGFLNEDDIANPSIAKLKGIKQQPGDLRYADLNGDGVIDDYDKGYIGNPTVPRYTYGFGFTVDWNNWYIGAFFQGIAECDFTISASNLKPFMDESAKWSLYGNIVNRWTPENQGVGAEWPRLDYGLVNVENYANSTFWLRNGSYVRMKTLDFGYNIPKSFTDRLKLSSARIFFQGYNLLTFSKFKLWDPEVGQGNGLSYPNTRSYNIGINFSF